MVKAGAYQSARPFNTTAQAYYNIDVKWYGRIWLGGPSGAGRGLTLFIRETRLAMNHYFRLHAS